MENFPVDGVVIVFLETSDKSLLIQDMVWMMRGLAELDIGVPATVVTVGEDLQNYLERTSGYSIQISTLYITVGTGSDQLFTEVIVI